jgi:hypothetical protein
MACLRKWLPILKLLSWLSECSCNASSTLGQPLLCQPRPLMGKLAEEQDDGAMCNDWQFSAVSHGRSDWWQHAQQHRTTYKYTANLLAYICSTSNSQPCAHVLVSGDRCEDCQKMCTKDVKCAHALLHVTTPWPLFFCAARILSCGCFKANASQGDTPSTKWEATLTSF